MSRQPFGTLQKEGDAYSSARLNFDRCKELTGCATHLQNLHTMITIRSSAASSKPTLIGLEVILTTPRSTYMISSNGSVADFSSPFGGGLFGAISWPRSQFRLASGVVLEQQMFFPNDGSAAAFSWQLHAQSPLQGRLTVRPSFSGCGPRSYRDLGFHFDSEENGGRLTWLPNVRGPKVIADTNGEYHNEPTRFIESSRDQETTSASSENLVTPGTFEFELTSCPSVLIFSMEGDAKTQHAQHVGAFLAGLMRSDIPSRTDLIGNPRSDVETGAQLVAASS
jgi:hypothetical protein